VVSAPLDRAQLWDTFVSRAERLGASVSRASSAKAAFSLIAMAAPAYRCTFGLAERYPDQQARCVAEPKSATDDLVTEAIFAVAESGSVAVDEVASDRGACFLTERLWLLVPGDAIVPTLDVAFELLHELVRGGSRHPLLVSGPSRTADIERVLTIGVHGPRQLQIVVIADA
jgi:L-lactate dehydrogenase complex protein LldG